MVHEVSSIQIRHYSDVRRQGALNFGDTLLDTRYYFVAILTFLHHHDATDDLAPSVVRQGTITNSRTIAHTCYITDKHRTSRSIRDSNLSDIFKRASHTHTSNKEGIRLLINIRSSCILIARLQSRIDIRQGQA